MNNPPTGTVTFLFTDIEGSTRLWEQHPHAMPSALARHDEILRSKIEAHNGHIFKTVGDAFCAAFPAALDALNAAIAVQRAIQTENWGEVGTLTVRSGIHSGAAQERDGDYFGQPLNRVARLMAAGHGGQILLSQSSYDLVRDHLPSGIELRDTGERRLRDLTQPEHIYQALVAGLPNEFPLLRTLDYRPNNLPAQPTILIGREKELEILSTLLRRGDVRLVTLTGPGGTGKTRLALQLAADLLDDFPDGVWFVDLAPITETRLVLPTIAQVLSLKEGADQPIIEVLKGYLANKQLLLVLDNFEQVIDASRDMAQLLSASPKLKIIATSRIPLRVRGEKEYPVSPLQLPDLKHLPSPDQLSQNASVRLFVERATDVKPDFRLNKENARPIAEICARLDGLPLAIELAAARIRLLSPDMLLSRLQNRLKLLTGGARDLPARQQTIFNTIDWSYDLLEEGEKQFFRRIAIFQGGRTLEAMEAVCNFDGKLQMDVLDGVESLVSKNLLQQRDDPEGEPRFWILETIHEYARTRLEESTDHKALQREHALYFMTMAEEAEPHLRGVGQSEWLARLDAELDNIRAAFTWAFATGDAHVALRVSGALRWFWELRGHLAEGRRLLRQALEHDSEVHLSLRAKALYGAGALASKQLDLEISNSLLEQSRAAYQAIGDKVGIGWSLNDLGLTALKQGNIALGRSLLEQSLALFREVADQKNTIFPLTNLADITRVEGDYDAARRMFEEVLLQTRESGFQDYTAIHLVTLGHILNEQGDYAGAIAYLIECMNVARHLGYKEMIAVCIAEFAGVATSLGQMDRAARLFGAADAHHEATIGIPVTSVDHGSEYRRDIANIRAQLGEEAFDKATREGRAMSMDEAVTYALDDETATDPA